MNALIATSFDSTNHTLAACAEALAARGHRVIMAVLDNDNIADCAMLDAGYAKLVTFDEIDETFMDGIDVVVGSAINPKSNGGVYRLAYEREIPIFSFANLLSSVTMRIKPDMVFAIGEATVADFRESGLRYNFEIVGCPQYDLLAKRRRKSPPERIGKVLVVEQGGYPYGEKGKRQLADTLVRIALLNPSISFHVKPRYSPTLKAGVLHAVSEHLYDYLTDLPSNLALLDSHESLESILIEYDAMITMWSTAVFAAIALNMPLILIEGLDSVDVFDVRTQRVDKAFARLRGSGCIAHFTDLGTCIEERFRLVNPGFAEREVANIGYPCADQVALRIERAYHDFANHGLRPCPPWEPTSLQPAQSNLHRIQTGYFALVNGQFQEFTYLNRCMGEVLDLSFFDRYYDADLTKIASDELSDFLKEVAKRLRDDFSNAKRNFFTSFEGQLLVEEDRILQDFYFDWLYEAGLDDLLSNSPVETILAPEGLEYNLARIELDRHNYRAAYDHLFTYLRIAASQPVQQLLRCKRMPEGLAPFKSGRRKALYYRWLFKHENEHLIDYLHKRPSENLIASLGKANLLNRGERYLECIDYCGEALGVHGQARLGKSPLQPGKWMLSKLIRRQQKIALRKRFAIRKDVWKT